MERDEDGDEDDSADYFEPRGITARSGNTPTPLPRRTTRNAAASSSSSSTPPTYPSQQSQSQQETRRKQGSPQFAPNGSRGHPPFSISALTSSPLTPVATPHFQSQLDPPPSQTRARPPPKRRTHLEPDQNEIQARPEQTASPSQGPSSSPPTRSFPYAATTSAPFTSTSSQFLPPVASTSSSSELRRRVLLSGLRETQDSIISVDESMPGQSLGSGRASGSGDGRGGSDGRGEDLDLMDVDGEGEDPEIIDEESNGMWNGVSGRGMGGFSGDLDLSVRQYYDQDRSRTDEHDEESGMDMDEVLSFRNVGRARSGSYRESANMPPHAEQVSPASVTVNKKRKMNSGGAVPSSSLDYRSQSHPHLFPQAQTQWQARSQLRTSHQPQSQAQGIVPSRLQDFFDSQRSGQAENNESIITEHEQSMRGRESRSLVGNDPESEMILHEEDMVTSGIEAGRAASRLSRGMSQPRAMHDPFGLLQSQAELEHSRDSREMYGSDRDSYSMNKAGESSRSRSEYDLPLRGRGVEGRSRINENKGSEHGHGRSGTPRGDLEEVDELEQDDPLPIIRAASPPFTKKANPSASGLGFNAGNEQIAAIQRAGWDAADVEDEDEDGKGLGQPGSRKTRPVGTKRKRNVIMDSDESEGEEEVNEGRGEGVTGRSRGDGVGQVGKPNSRPNPSARASSSARTLEAPPSKSQDVVDLCSDGESSVDEAQKQKQKQRKGFGRDKREPGLAFEKKEDIPVCTGLELDAAKSESSLNTKSPTSKKFSTKTERSSSSSASDRKNAIQALELFHDDDGVVDVEDVGLGDGLDGDDNEDESEKNGEGKAVFKTTSRLLGSRATVSQALKWDKLDWDALAKAIKIGKDDLSIQLASPKQIEQLRSGVRVQGYGTIFVVFRHSNYNINVPRTAPQRVLRCVYLGFESLELLGKKGEWLAVPVGYVASVTHEGVTKDAVDISSIPLYGVTTYSLASKQADLVVLSGNTAFGNPDKLANRVKRLHHPQTQIFFYIKATHSLRLFDREGLDEAFQTLAVLRGTNTTVATTVGNLIRLNNAGLATVKSVKEALAILAPLLCSNTKQNGDGTSVEEAVPTTDKEEEEPVVTDMYGLRIGKVYTSTALMAGLANQTAYRSFLSAGNSIIGGKLGKIRNVSTGGTTQAALRDLFKPESDPNERVIDFFAEMLKENEYAKHLGEAVRQTAIKKKENDEIRQSAQYQVVVKKEYKLDRVITSKKGTASDRWARMNGLGDPSEL